MLTRLRVQGFKNLFDVEFRFGPFTCVAGKNAVGKSNLFDAVRFLHLLTKFPIAEAVQMLREAKGRSQEPQALFSTFGAYRASEIRFMADMIVSRDISDDFGVSARAAISSIRYELAFRLRARDRYEQLELVHESLKPVSLEDARKGLGFKTSQEFRATAISGRRPQSFVSTSGKPEDLLIQVHQEGHGGRRVPAPKSSWTVIGGMASSDFPTVLAAHREMESWQTLMLEPSAMRAPSEYRDPQMIDDRGGNLPAAVERLRRHERREGQVQSELANRLAELIDDVQAVRVRDDERTETLTLEVQGQGGIFHPARSLSDGTLRFLVLAALSVDPLARGLICLEEPENGMHPERIPAMLDLLRDIAVDPGHGIGEDNPLRQVIVNTHSPLVVRQVALEELIYLKEKKIFQGQDRGTVAWATAPPRSWRSKVSEPTPPGDLRPYGAEQLGLPLAG